MGRRLYRVSPCPPKVESLLRVVAEVELYHDHVALHVDVMTGTKRPYPYRRATFTSYGIGLPACWLGLP